MLRFNKFTLSLPDNFTGLPWDDEKQDQATCCEEVSAVVTNFHLRAFFVAGLQPDILKEVIKAGPYDIDSILAMAKRLEQAKMQEKKTSPPAGSALTSAAMMAAVNALLAELCFGPNAKPKESGKRRKLGGDIICFYCGAAHLASKCERRAADRGRGVWRPTVKCPESSKSQWDSMSKDERQKGAKIFGKASNAPAGAGQAPAAQGGVANVIPGLTYSDAAGNSLESAYAAYRQNRQGN